MSRIEKRVNFALTDIYRAERRSINTARVRIEWHVGRGREPLYIAGYVLCEADGVMQVGAALLAEQGGVIQSRAASFRVGYVCRRRGRANAARDEKIATMKF